MGQFVDMNTCNVLDKNRTFIYLIIRFVFQYSAAKDT
jgi:hypothetical protein